MAFRPIDFEYRMRPRRLGRALFALGLAAAAATVLAWLDLSDEAHVWARAVAANGPATGRASAAADPALAQRVEQAGQVIRRLSLPWDGLFRGMEAAGNEHIALLGVEPDPVRGKVTLSGEAQAYAEVLRYMTRLDAGAVLTQPQLLNHEVRTDGAQHPVAFSIAATWRTAP